MVESHAFLNQTCRQKHEFLNMLYPSQTSFLYALTPFFLMPRPGTDFTDDHHQFTYQNI